MPGTDGDSMRGGRGNDFYEVTSSRDQGFAYTASGQAMTETIGNYTPDLVVEGLGEGTDTVNAYVSYVLPSNVENLQLHEDSFDINGTGNNLDNVITGNGDDNVLKGLGGNDILNGGNGPHGYFGQDNDTLDGGVGRDTASYVGAVAGVVVTLAKLGTQQNTVSDGLDTLVSIESLTGSDFNDTLSGNTINNELRGGLGDDILYGGLGDDVLNGGAGRDTASYVGATAGVVVTLAKLGAQQNTASAGSDTLYGIEHLVGSKFNDTLTGNIAANILDGGAGNDVLAGGAGNDILLGGAGSDTLKGEAGGDFFRFNALAETGVTPALRDVIVDFNFSQGDRINLSAIDANTTSPGNQSFSSPTQGGVFSGVFANSGALYFDQTTHILYGNNDADSAADFSIQLLGVGSLSTGALML